MKWKRKIRMRRDRIRKLLFSGAVWKYLNCSQLVISLISCSLMLILYLSSVFHLLDMNKIQCVRS